MESPQNIVSSAVSTETITVEDSPSLKVSQRVLESSAPVEEKGGKDIIAVEREPDMDSEDNVSVSSLTESLKIDESAKDSLLSPYVRHTLVCFVHICLLVTTQPHLFTYVWW